MTKNNSNRKPWMKHLKTFKFSADGMVLQSTARAQKAANSRAATCVKLSSKFRVNEYTTAELTAVLNSNIRIN